MKDRFADAAAHEAALRGLMRLYEAGDKAGVSSATADIFVREENSLTTGVTLPFCWLARMFGLDEREKHLLMCAWFGDFSLEEAIALRAPDDTEEAILRAAHAAFARRSTLGMLFEEDSFIGAPLRLRRRFLRFLRDPASEGDFEAGLWFPQAPRPLTYGGEDISRLLRALQEPVRAGSGAVVWLSGEAGAGRSLRAQHIAHALECPLLFVSAIGLPALPELIAECALRGAVPCLTEADEWMEHASAKLQSLAEHFSLVVVITNERAHSGMTGGAPRFALHVESPDAAQRRLLWEDLGAQYPLCDVDLDIMSGKFAFVPGQIAGALVEAASSACYLGEEGITEAALHAACRAQVRQRLSGHAACVETRVRWDDLILPAAQKGLLRLAIDQVRDWQTVYGRWGLEKKFSYGKGLSMLLSGPPGTGKTMAAQAVASELMLDLYKVDLSSVVSKYVGETERNLRQVFSEVERSQGILFFDEADALFGKRTEVKDAQDRYANIEASFLLQRIEEYRGIVILATNIFQNFDEAFRRRIRFVVDFPFPEATQREAIWRATLPGDTPLADDIDFRFLSRFELTGSSIRNICVNAAFLAARAKSPVGMRQMLGALRMEMNKAGKAFVREELGAYDILLPDQEDL